MPRKPNNLGCQKDIGFCVVLYEKKNFFRVTCQHNIYIRDLNSVSRWKQITRGCFEKRRPSRHRNKFPYCYSPEENYVTGERNRLWRFQKRKSLRQTDNCHFLCSTGSVFTKHAMMDTAYHFPLCAKTNINLFTRMGETKF